MKRKNKEIKGRVSRYLFEQEKQVYYKPGTVRNFWGRNYIQYEPNADRNKTLLIEEYLNKNRPYLKDIINDLKNLIRGKFN